MARRIHICLTFAVFVLLGATPAAAEPQILGLIASLEPVTLQCARGECGGDEVFAARQTAKLINALPPGGRASETQRNAVWQSVALPSTPPTPWRRPGSTAVTGSRGRE